MAKQKQSTVQKAPVAEKPVAPKSFRIPYPLVWIALAVLLVYAPSFNLGFTELDDTIFVRDFHEYNEHLSNLLTSFQRGVFDPVKDTYYRPFFLDSVLLNYQVSGQSPVGYHLVNILFHLASTFLLFKLFRKLHLKETTAFILTILFAVHPVLTQAVSWIPGRNDTMLAIFSLSFFIFSIDYAEKGQIRSLIFSFLCLTAAYFTKETAVFVAPVAFVLINGWLKKNWLEQKQVIQYGAWVAAFLLWLGVRSTATIQASAIVPSQILQDSMARLPLILQYLGKIFIPVNLSVFPILEDTVIIYGIIAAALLATIIWLSPNKDMRKTLSGFAVFLLLLLPVMLVPRSFNEQTFEHRLYLPIIGMLLVLPQTILFNNKLKEQQILTGALVVAGIFSVINYNRQPSFNDPLSFWTEAVRTSPHSAYANMMLGARIEDKAEGRNLFRKAYALNPKEKYLNYYYGVMLQGLDSVQASEKYLLQERNTSDYYECDFYLARVYLERNDMAKATEHLERYITRDPANPMANNNLLLLYMNTAQKQKAQAQAKKMQELGINVDPQALQRINQL